MMAREGYWLSWEASQNPRPITSSQWYTMQPCANRSANNNFITCSHQIFGVRCGSMQYLVLIEFLCDNEYIMPISGYSQFGGFPEVEP